MKAAVTEAPGAMRIADVPDLDEPDEGEVLVRPEAVGLCGSDFHYFLGHLGDAVGTDLYPRVQGHEFAGVVEAVGPGGPAGLRTGERVAVWPVTACGHCYPCRIGRRNACSNISLVGIHRDGALQERVRVPAEQVFPVGELDAAASALIEPVSIAIRAIVRSRIEAGEKAVVLGAGPIGQALAAAAIDRGASVLLVDRVTSRVEHGSALGADLLTVDADDELVAAGREWAGDEGP
jgi:L-gulonate 5-dehydrogenase